MLTPYLLGVVTAPLVAKATKNVLRGVVKTSVGITLEAKRAAAEAGGEFQAIAAEVSAEQAANAG